MRKLAYPVDKHARGYYTVLFYKAEGTIISELERNLKISEDVIKFLSVKYSKNKELAQFDKLVAAANKSAAPEAEATPATPAPEVEAAAPAPEVEAKPETAEAKPAVEAASTEA
jgi:small subunit ribosomal protein S6